ncbi:MAG: hypothetical protein Q4E87_08885, partial [bacterium]|nr:hypothetical protein [bacterium]
EAIQYLMHKDYLKSEIKELENRKLQMIATLGPRPLKKSYETMETRVVKRSAIGQFFLGDKCKSFAVTHTNDDEIAAYAKEKEAIEARFAKEEADLKEKLKGFNKTSTNVAFYQEQQKQVERMQQEKKNEIENLRREHQEKFKAGREKAVRKLRNQITTTINEMETEIMNRLYNEMCLRRDDVLAIINDIVEKNVREKCNQKIEEKERLQSILESSIQERNAQVLASEEKIKALTEVSAEVENLVIDLEMIEVDHIEYSV